MPLFQQIIDYIRQSDMDTDGTLTANSDTKLATQKAIKTFVNAVANAISILRLYRSGTLKNFPKMYTTSAVVSSGTVVFNLTDDNTSSGNALFTTVYKESLNWWIEDAANQYQVGSYTLAGTNKTLTLTVNKVGLSLGILVFTSAANGVTVNMTIWGD